MVRRVNNFNGHSELTMSNYQQPNFSHGYYVPVPGRMPCPLCANQEGMAVSIQSGSGDWRCQFGHYFIGDKTGGPFRPVADEPNAEIRVPLTILQRIKG